MLESIGIQLIVFILTAVLGTLSGVFIGLHSKVKALFEITKAQGRKDIMTAYDHYVVREHKMTVERYDELHRIYEAYRKLGGNGTAHRLWSEIVETCNPYIVH